MCHQSGRASRSQLIFEAAASPMAGSKHFGRKAPKDSPNECPPPHRRSTHPRTMSVDAGSGRGKRPDSKSTTVPMATPSLGINDGPKGMRRWPGRLVRMAPHTHPTSTEYLHLNDVPHRGRSGDIPPTEAADAGQGRTPGKDRSSASRHALRHGRGRLVIRKLTGHPQAELG